MFDKFHTNITFELQEDKVDMGSLTQSLIMKLKEGLIDANPRQPNQ